MASDAIQHLCSEVVDIDAAYRFLHSSRIAQEKEHSSKAKAERLWTIDIFDHELARIEIRMTAPNGTQWERFRPWGCEPSLNPNWHSRFVAAMVRLRRHDQMDHNPGVHRLYSVSRTFEIA
jgi:hypothetical protein